MRKLKMSHERTHRESPESAPAFSNDPVAKQTDWSTINRSGSSLLTHRLVEKSVDRLEFRITTRAVLFLLTFVLVGVLALGWALVSSWFGVVLGFLPALCVALFGLTCMCVSVWKIHRGTEPIAFDKRVGAFCKGRVREADIRSEQTDQLNCVVDLEQIHALQMLTNFRTKQQGANRPYYWYELNLVLLNGDRLHVIEHGGQKQMHSDAERLSAFLNIPVWKWDCSIDATRQQTEQLNESKADTTMAQG